MQDQEICQNLRVEISGQNSHAANFPHKIRSSEAWEPQNEKASFEERKEGESFTVVVLEVDGSDVL
jgi:hypothetical protein